MKKIVSILLVLILIFALSACKKENSTSSESDIDTESVVSSIDTATQNITNSNNEVENDSSLIATSSEKTTSSKPIVSSQPATSSRPTTSSKPATPSNHTTNSEPTTSYGPTISSELTSPTVSEVVALKCLNASMLSDTTIYYETTEEFQFIYDVVFYERINAEFAIKSAKVINATVDGGKECQILQSSTKENALRVAKNNIFESDCYETFEGQLTDWGYSEVEIACRCISPKLIDKIYDDFIIEIEIQFENGAVTIVEFCGKQSMGEGGYAWGNLNDSDYF